MSMLAERRKKQKFIINPKGSVQNVDTNNVAWKMMQKMGWSKGKGLGAQESGMKEYIRVRYKNDTSGVGFKDSEEDDKSGDFNALLASLQASNSSTVVPTTIQPKPVSLEEKSQQSRVRVHYKKFTRGKDLSRYSEKDLANIFGKKTLRKLSDGLATADSNKGEGDQTACNDQMENVLLKNCGSITDYFKTKPKQQKSFNAEQKVTKLQVESDQEISFENNDEIDTVTKTNFTCYENECFDENDTNDNGGTEECVRSHFEIVRKPKKKKVKEMSTYSNEGLDVSVNTDESCTFKQKKKKSKKAKSDCFVNAAFNFNDAEENTNSNSDFEVKRKRKTAKNDTLDNSESVGMNTTIDFEVRRKTKKTQGDGEIYENPALNVLPEFAEMEATPSSPVDTPNHFEVKRKNKKKSRKRKNDDCFENPGLNLSANDTTDSNGTPLKRRRSVRFSNVNQEYIIPNLSQQQQWEKEELFEINVQVLEKNVAFENDGFDLHQANLEENINLIANTIDKYQAEIENDINEAKVVE